MKSFDDLHKLYWVCVREQNRVLTREKERQRTRAGYGSKETEIKVIVVSFPSSNLCSFNHNDEPHPFTRRYEFASRTLNLFGHEIVLLESFLNGTPTTTSQMFPSLPLPFRPRC